ncbi:hypothetical protein [Candidatus Methylomicrobium oryzae]|jgi:hypothetical protein|uniref:hypothetical protein n=1 Tax=Candidatus Methylomicrobium oryzae TaxID=2802053 RepID=UPI001922551E|nr:hypothetical protein [Methylomicrobium sp. RS1]MBL1263582.1 hypothetical protein [Methylomicrobium sp. RS1]
MSNLPYEETHKPHIGSGISPQRSRRMRWIKGISWTSVFAGVVVALGVQMLLSTLGTGIGMSMIDPLRAQDTPTVSEFSIGAGLWWVVSSFLSLFIGGWVAAQFSGYLRHLDGVLHGLLVWALGTLITIYFLGSAIGSIASGTGNMLNAGTRSVAEKAVTVVSGDEIRKDAEGLLLRQPRPGVEPRSAIMDPEFSMALERFLTAEDRNAKEINRTALINLLTARTGLSIDEATNRVNRWERTYAQAEQKVREAADQAAKAVAWSALWGFLVILVSAIAAAVGGYVGTQVPDGEARERSMSR